MSTFDDPEHVKVGKCDLIEEVIIGEDRLIKFSGKISRYYFLQAKRKNLMGQFHILSLDQVRVANKIETECRLETGPNALGKPGFE